MKILNPKGKEKRCSKKKKRNKRERGLKYKKHLKNLAEITCRYYPCPAIYSNSYYKRLYRGKRSKYLKRQSNKKIRKYKRCLSDGNMYRKVFDFWWELT